MSFWCCAQISVPRQNLALHYLALSGYETYLPRIRARRTAPRRGGVPSVALFPGYCFILIGRGWWEARWSPGVIRMIASGLEHVPDRITEDLRAREVGGLVQLPEAPRFRSGDRVRITQGGARGRPPNRRLAARAQAQTCA